MAENKTSTSDRLTLFDKPVFDLFVNPGDIVEVRIPTGKGTLSGYFDNHEPFCKAVRDADKQTHGGIYFTLQSIDRRLLARAHNRIKTTNLTTSDNNGIAYKWLPVDIDPVRPSGISSSNSELQKAFDVRETVQAYLEALGFVDPIRAMSGNGYHLLYRLPDLPVNDYQTRWKVFE